MKRKPEEKEKKRLKIPCYRVQICASVASFLFAASSKPSFNVLSKTMFRGGSRGRVQGVPTPPPRDDLRFSNTTGILQKKKLCGLLVLK